MRSDVEKAILATEKVRCDAMLGNDNVTLGDILDPRLHFSHATGAVDDKHAYLAKMATGRIQYVAINWTEEKIVELAPDTAMLTGQMTTDVRVEGTEKRLNNRVLAIWCLSDEKWRLAAFQSTPLVA